MCHQILSCSNPKFHTHFPKKSLLVVGTLKGLKPMPTRIPIHIVGKCLKKPGNGENSNQTNEFFYKTSGLDRINTNTHLEIITYRKELSMIGGSNVTHMTYIVSYEIYGTLYKTC